MLITSLLSAVNIAELLAFVLCDGVQSKREEVVGVLYLEMEVPNEIRSWQGQATKVVCGLGEAED
jgi:hypothetical protein